MSFLTIEGKIEIDPLESSDPELLLGRLEEALRSARASSIERAYRTISFRAGLFRPVWGWNVLASVGTGEVEVDGSPTRAIKYRLSMVQLFVVSLLMGGWLAFAPALMGRPVDSFPLLAIPAWAWLFGANYLLAKSRVPKFLRQAISESR